MSIVYGGYSSYAGDYYARGLGHILRSYRLWDQDFALSKDPEVYERLRRDPVVAFAMRYRKLLAAGSDWYLEPAGPSDEDRKLAKILEELLKHVEYFTMARYNLAEAIISGSRWGKIEGEIRKIRIADISLSGGLSGMGDADVADSEDGAPALGLGGGDDSDEDNDTEEGDEGDESTPEQDEQDTQDDPDGDEDKPEKPKAFALDVGDDEPKSSGAGKNPFAKGKDRAKGKPAAGNPFAKGTKGAKPGAPGEPGMDGEPPEVDAEPIEWWVATHIMDVDKRRFRQFPLDQPPTEEAVQWPGPPGGPMTQAQLPEVHREWVWQLFRPLQQRWETFERDDFVRHVHDDREDALGYGSGLASELYMYWYAKEVVLQQGLQYLERWSQGIVLAGVNTLRDGLASAPASGKRMQDWLNVLGQMRSRHVLVHDAQDKFDIKDAPQQGWRAALEALEYLDGALRVSILGASLPTSQKVDGGSYALAEVQQRTTETLNKFDHACLEDSIRRDLLGWLIRKNRPTLVSLGLEDRTTPFFRLRSSNSDNHAERADILLKARQAGMDIRLDEAYAQLGFSVPTHFDEILTPLGQQESMSQGGDPFGDEEGGEGDVLGEDGAAGTPRDEREKANPLRPNHKGSKPGLREKAIDTQTSGFSASGLSADGGGEIRQIVINVPRQDAPVVNVAAPAVTVKVPKQSPPVVNVPPSLVEIHPEFKIPPESLPPIVVQLPPRQSRTIEVERNRDGTISKLELKSPEDPK